MITSPARLPALAAVMVLVALTLAACTAQESAQEPTQDSVEVPRPQESASPAPSTAITVSFKLDPRLTKSLYMGERWVSPPTYSGARTGATFAVEARAEGRDAKGRLVAVDPEWRPADPDMVAVSPARGRQVTIHVLREGESRLSVASPGGTKELLVKASRTGGTIHVAISR